MALDADVLITFLDASDAQHHRAVELLRPRLAAGAQLLIAASVDVEILVHPLQHGSDHTVDAVIHVIGAQIVPVDRDIARRAAQRRASHRALRLPDAISLATALVAGAEFVTLDGRLATTEHFERTTRRLRHAANSVLAWRTPRSSRSASGRSSAAGTA